MGMPDFWLGIGWGLDPNCWNAWASLGANNVAIGTNPPYQLADFAAWYPKFLGTPTIATAAITLGSPTALLAAAAPGIAPGQLIAGAGLAPNTLVVSLAVDLVTVTLSAAATATNPTAALSLYTAPLIPIPILAAYIALASASISQARWFDLWPWAMALYVAHFSTLWLLTEGVPGQTAQQVALAGAQRGISILTSKAADGVSASYQPISISPTWGSFNLTSYGIQLVGQARLIGMGGMWLSP